MKRLALIFGTALAAGSFGQAIKTGSQQGAGVDQLFDAYYRPSSEQTFTGAVTGKVKGSPANGMAESMSILVRDSKNRVHQVDLGPTWYIARQSAKINMGDKVKVTGSALKVGNKEKFLLARQIVRGRQVLVLRDHSGNPYWVAYRKGRIDVSPNSVTGTIVGTTEVNAEQQREMAYQLKTADGLINVAVAPDWYLQQQGLGFKVGDNITVYTGVGPSHFGPNIILANGIYDGSYSGGTYVLRPGGSPAWGGWTTITH